MDDSRTFTRRSALRLVGGAGLALSVPILTPQQSRAAIGWCRADPVIELMTPDEKKRNNASVYLSAALEEWELNNSSGDIVIEHPKDTKTNKLWEDPNGYFGQGVSTNFAINEKLRFRSGYMEVRVKCFVPASRSDMKIRLDWAPGPIVFGPDGNPLPAPVIASATGYANKWIVLTSRLPYA